MARPLDIGKKLKQIFSDLLQEVFGRPVPRKGRPAIDQSAVGRLVSLQRTRAERPTRNLGDFAYIQEVLANMPAANAAVRQLSEDVALDETGDPRAWTLAVKADPVDDSDETKEKISDFKDNCQKIFDDYAIRTGIGDEAKNYVFKFLTAGDCFAEQVITIDSKTGIGRIERIVELPTWQMIVKWDDTGELIGYEQRLFRGSFDDSRTNISWDIPGQIIHWKFHPTAYMQYGESVFSHLRSRWEQFKLVELDAIAAIHTHAVDPTVILLGSKDGTTPITDEELLREEQKLRDNPTDINRFFVGRMGQVEYVFPKTGSADAVHRLLEAHRDLENRFVEAIVPGQVKSNAFDVARRAVSTSFDQKYARKVTSIRQDFTRYLRASIFLEFALHGIDFSKPEQYGAKKISIDIAWPDISESRIQRSKRIVGEWIAGLISHETALRERGDNDPEGELDLLKREHENGDYPLALIISPQISPNNEQGKGVPTDPADGSGTGGNAASVLGSFFADPEDFRQIIREEISALINN